MQTKATLKTKRPNYTPAMTTKAIGMRAKGRPIVEIAADLECNAQSLGRHLAKPNIRDRIERETEKLLESGLSPSRETLVGFARKGAKMVQGEITDFNTARLALDASKTILGAAGITSQGSTTINNILNVTQNPDIAKELSQLSEFLASKMRPQIECIDVGI
jgi:N-methylhydantoinase A/oxoprolinase/acetone carboxylase beta subunit